MISRNDAIQLIDAVANVPVRAATTGAMPARAGTPTS